MKQKNHLCSAKRMTAWTLSVLLAVSLGGCGTDSGKGESRSQQESGSSSVSETSGHIVENLDGTEIRVPDNVKRIAAVYGPSYEICAALGAEDRIVVAADVQFENFPWAEKVFKKMKSLPYLENVHSSVNYEELQTYAPDLVLTFNRPNELSQLRKSGVAAVNGVTPRTLEEDKQLVRIYGEALGGTAVERSQLYTEYFDEVLQKITDRTSQLSEEDRPSVYYAGIDMLTTYGNQSDLVEAIEAAGGSPVMKDLEAGNHTSIGFEQLASWNPEYIFIDHGGMNDKKTAEQILKGTASRERYQAISAVSSGQMYLVPSGTFYWDMGIQKILLIEYMAKILHPDLFDDLDMTEEIRNFYSTFFSYDLTEKEAEQILQRKDPS